MPAHSRARVLSVENEDERRHQLTLIETMLRDGYDEHEIVAALNGQAIRSPQSNVVSLVDWVRGKLVK